MGSAIPLVNFIPPTSAANIKNEDGVTPIYSAGAWVFKNAAGASTFTISEAGVIWALGGSGASNIVNADIAANAGIVDTKLAAIATAGKVSNSATTATSANTASAIIARDGAGAFSAGAASLSSVSASSTINATGGIGTNASLYLKFKEVTGTTGPVSTYTAIAHGLTKANIKCIAGRVFDYFVPGDVNANNYFTISVDDTNVNVFNAALGSGASISLIITYV